MWPQSRIGNNCPNGRLAKSRDLLQGLVSLQGQVHIKRDHSRAQVPGTQLESNLTLTNLRWKQHLGLASTTQRNLKRRLDTQWVKDFPLPATLRQNKLLAQAHTVMIVNSTTKPSQAQKWVETEGSNSSCKLLPMANRPQDNTKSRVLQTTRKLECQNMDLGRVREPNWGLTISQAQAPTTTQAR